MSSTREIYRVMLACIEELEAETERERHRTGDRDEGLADSCGVAAAAPRGVLAGRGMVGIGD